VLSWLVGDESADFLTDKFGRQWHHTSWFEPRVNFTVGENLGCLKDFNPGPDRMEYIMRMVKYGPERKSVETPDWAKPLKFWSATMCRSQNGNSEDIDDEARISDFLMRRQVCTAGDLRKHGENWTFILNQVQGSSHHLQGLHHALWAFFGLSGGINSYITPGFATGKVPHTDDHDVFVLQQGGEKLWTLFDDDMRETIQEVTLKPGSVLYIPQGVPHCARSVSADPSLHLAVSVSRTQFTAAGVLAGCLELRTGTMSREVALRIEERRERLVKGGSPWDPLSQLLPDARPLLQAFDATDLPCPEHFAKLAAYLTRVVEEHAAPRLLQASSDKQRSDGIELQGLMSASRAEKQLIHAFWALREYFFEEHYMIHMPMALPDIDMDVCLSSDPDALAASYWRRPANTAALLLRDGTLVVNGYRIFEVPAEIVESLRFCMGVNTGARGLPFSFDDIPGPVAARRDALELLLRFQGLELCMKSEKRVLLDRILSALESNQPIRQVA